MKCAQHLSSSLHFIDRADQEAAAVPYSTGAAAAFVALYSTAVVEQVKSVALYSTAVVAWEELAAPYSIAVEMEVLVVLFGPSSIAASVLEVRVDQHPTAAERLMHRGLLACPTAVARQPEGTACTFPQLAAALCSSF
jgi:hypothetical protein